jgi:hypothetical protein
VTVIASTTLLAAAGNAAADTVKIDRADPPRSFQLPRGAGAIDLTITVKYELDSADTGQMHFTAYDQRGRPVTTTPITPTQVKRGQDVIIFKTTLKRLTFESERVTVVVSLFGDRPGKREARSGDPWVDTISYRVRKADRGDPHGVP